MAAQKSKQKSKKKSAKKSTAKSTAQAGKKPLKQQAKSAKKSKVKLAQKPVAKPVKKAVKKPTVASQKAKPAVATKSPVKTGSAKALDFTKILTPLDNRVIVRREEFASRTAGGLYIPDTVAFDDRHKQGEVIAVGPGRRNKRGQLRPLDVKKGDTVLFNGFAGSEVRVENHEFLILAEDEILGVLRP